MESFREYSIEPSGSIIHRISLYNKINVIEIMSIIRAVFIYFCRFTSKFSNEKNNAFSIFKFTAHDYRVEY